MVTPHHRRTVEGGQLRLPGGSACGLGCRTQTHVQVTHSTHDFYGHHAAAISLAIVTGEAEAIVSGVSRRETALAGGEHRG